MKNDNAKFIIVQILFFGILSLPEISNAATPVDPLANAKTKGVLDYLYTLPSLSSNRIISGQYTENRSGSSATSCSGSASCDDISIIYNAAGKYLGFMGLDWTFSNLSNQSVIDYWNAGGLIQVGTHIYNPGTGGDAWDTTSVDINRLTQSGTTENTRLTNFLNGVAAHLSALQTAGVVVFFRPLHEMNGSWFWWSSLGQTNYKTLWVYVYNYMTTTKGLHNLLWVWSPNGYLDSGWYPGNNYVDVVSVDLYGVLAPGAVSGYSSLTTTYGGKPFFLGEWGVCSGGLYESGCSRQDISSFITAVKNNMPRTVAWLAWNNIYSMAYHTGVSTILSDPWVITRDEIPKFSGVDTQAPAPPTGLTVK